MQRRADMLVVTRRQDESLTIADNIEITILEVSKDKVKIGISAPKEVPVYRKEVYIQIQEANKEATDNTEAVNQLASLFK